MNNENQFIRWDCLEKKKKGSWVKTRVRKLGGGPLGRRKESRKNDDLRRGGKRPGGESGDIRGGMGEQNTKTSKVVSQKEQRCRERE